MPRVERPLQRVPPDGCLDIAVAIDLDPHPTPSVDGRTSQGVSSCFRERSTRATAALSSLSAALGAAKSSLPSPRMDVPYCSEYPSKLRGAILVGYAPGKYPPLLGYGCPLLGRSPNEDGGCRWSQSLCSNPSALIARLVEKLLGMLPSAPRCASDRKASMRSWGTFTSPPQRLLLSKLKGSLCGVMLTPRGSTCQGGRGEGEPALAAKRDCLRTDPGRERRAGARRSSRVARGDPPLACPCTAARRPPPRTSAGGTAVPVPPTLLESTRQPARMGAQRPPAPTSRRVVETTWSAPLAAPELPARERSAHGSPAQRNPLAEAEDACREDHTQGSSGPAAAACPAGSWANADENALEVGRNSRGCIPRERVGREGAPGGAAASPYALQPALAASPRHLRLA
eukprot:scaffold5816_cov267-Pinguiococcus_pyrenoidosus.AAC.8